jgi:hypothetical protein
LLGAGKNEFRTVVDDDNALPTAAGTKPSDPDMQDCKLKRARTAPLEIFMVKRNDEVKETVDGKAGLLWD